MIGHIPGYYGADDDYFYLIKTVYRIPPKFSKPIAPGTEEATSSEHSEP